jgi:hypothetical protein
MTIREKGVPLSHKWERFGGDKHSSLFTQRDDGKNSIMTLEPVHDAASCSRNQVYRRKEQNNKNFFSSELMQ